MSRETVQRKRMLNAIGMGSAEIVRECLEAGVDPNGCDSLGRTPLIRAVRCTCVESNVVDVLLEFGADPQAEDSLGRTALFYARRRLERLGPGPDKIHHSEALDEHGNLRLSPEEQAQIDETAEELRRDSPQAADEFVEMYLQERRKAALHQNMPRRELKIIIRRLEEVDDDSAHPGEPAGGEGA